MSLACGLLPDRRAVVAVELALVSALVVLPLTLGAVDGGLLVMARSRLDGALQAAFYFCYANGGNVTAGQVQSAAVAGYGTASPAPAASAALSQYCVGTAGYPQGATPPAPSNGTCPSGDAVETYAVVTVSRSVQLPFAVSFSPSSVLLSVTGRARVQ